MEEKEYHEVFFKDDRNRRGGTNAKKRTNVKEMARRNAQMEKREVHPEQGVHPDPLSDSEEEEPRRKYDNGKAKRVVREQ